MLEEIIESAIMLAVVGLSHLYEHGVLEVPAKYGDEVKYYSSISKDLALKHFLEYANDNLET